MPHASKVDWESRGRDWWSHIRVLADDALEGRATGSPGYQRAAEYVSQQFQAAGLEPGGVDGFLQPAEFRVTELIPSASRLSLIANGASRQLELPTDGQFWVSSETATDLEAEAVFIGYGLDIPEYRYNDLAGIDLKGKIGVYFRGGPSDIPSPIKAHYQSPAERYRALRRAGLVGSVRLVNPKVADLPWDRLGPWLSIPKLELEDGRPSDARPLPLVMLFNPARFDTLLAASGHSAAEIMDRLGGPGPLPRFPLNIRLRAHVEVRRSSVRSANVVGIRRGSDPALRNEYVVGSAHLDHLGLGAPVNGDPIYHGAMDNASGVATLIEIAKATQAPAERPRRSMLFLAVTGEENGLLGSEYFAEHPSVPGKFVADLNMDMFLPLYPLRRLEVQGLEESTLATDLRAVAGAMQVEVDSDYEPERVLFVRSDQYNFVKVGVPSLMLSLGYRKGSTEEEISKAWFHERYHSPADDLRQPVDLVAAAQFTDLLRQLMVRVANGSTAPSWNPDSFFRRFVR